MHAADLNRSDRLRRVDEFLSDGQWHSTRDIVFGAHVCAVSAAISELRQNGRRIETRRAHGRWYYRRMDIQGQTELFAA